ncbi:tetratricopeptide repeat protein [Streptomyces melanogenes]|uniref:tetratricopeptide repeat protein n=1 Tax=Streptomyces melanogenes TaxID=67326 RepID=UPI003798CBD1
MEAGQRALESALWGDVQAAAELGRLRAPLDELAQAGDGAARSLLGGVALEYDKDLNHALRHFSLAAEQGHPAGLRGLGYLYQRGLGVDRDLEAAERLFRLAADAGDSYAKFNLAMTHFVGEQTGDRMSPAQVMSLLVEAAEGGIQQASAVLGDWFADLDREAEAFQWYLTAANAGNAAAMFAVAQRLRDGLGIERDDVEAVCWFLKMLQVGDGDGIHEAIEMARTMSDADLRRAGRKAGDVSGAETLIHTVRRPGSAD